MVLAHHLALLNSKRLVLASGSPRRSELLKMLGLRFEVHVSTFDETLNKSSFASAADYARETALHKAIEVAQRRYAEGQLADLVIAADTVVDIDGVVLEKPDGASGAEAMLARLNGCRHAVHTGVALVLPHAVVSFSETTQVEFATLSPELIRAYVATGEPFGKAGAYGIQGVGGSFVKGINGCYYNVMGLPLHRFAAEVVSLIESSAL